MLFITNRRIEGGRRSEAGREIAFAPSDPEPAVSLYFCQRVAAERYLELTSTPFFSQLRRSPRQQILFFVHGFNCQPEAGAFPAAQRLQAMCDALTPDLVEVVPVIWPCDDDLGLTLDYWDDQRNADVTGLVMARVLGKFMAWRDRLGLDEACLKHVNILAHSMGNRVLTGAMASWANDYGAVPAAFRSLFLAAPDLANDVFAPGRPGAVLADAARNVVVYHANDDLALRSSKVVNLRHKLVRRRLGHTGPAALDESPTNVVAVDCDAFNGRYDRLGHSYFLGEPDGRPGALLGHLVETLRTGRVAGAVAGRRLILTGPLTHVLTPAANADAPAALSGLAEPGRPPHSPG